MQRNKFVKLYESKKEQIGKTGKKSPEWFLGYLEGFGNQKLTGYQVGALYHLTVLPDAPESELSEESNEIISGDSKKVSVPGIF